MNSSVIKLVVAIWLGSPVIAQAQATAVPLLSGGERQIALTIQTAFQTHRIVQDRTDLGLGIGRLALGLRGQVDLYLLGGVVRQRIAYDDPARSAFNSRSAWAIGGGFSLQKGIPFINAVNATLAMQGLVFSPRGSSDEKITSPTTSFTGKKHDLEFNWLVMQASLLLSHELGRFEFFGGGTVLFDRVDQSRKTYLTSPDASYFVNAGSGLFYESLRIAGNIGVSIHLPGRHQLGFEIRALSIQDYSIAIGLSQTGSPD